MTLDLMTQGLELMIAGMGTVFVFLSALVAATMIMSRLVKLIEGPQGSALEADASAEEIAVITAAITEHRRGQRR